MRDENLRPALTKFCHCFSANERTSGMRMIVSFTYCLFDRILQMGTCAMKAREQGGVVDERLNVYGVQNLKVAGKCLPFCFVWKKNINPNISLFRLQYNTGLCRS